MRARPAEPPDGTCGHPHLPWPGVRHQDLVGDRTSDHSFLANRLRLFFSRAAYVLHHALRTEVLARTELAKAQPSTVILKLFKIAVRFVQHKDRVKPNLPSRCPVKHLLVKIRDILSLAPGPALDTT